MTGKKKSKKIGKVISWFKLIKIIILGRHMGCSPGILYKKDGQKIHHSGLSFSSTLPAEMMSSKKDDL